MLKTPGASLNHLSQYSNERTKEWGKAETGHQLNTHGEDEQIKVSSDAQFGLYVLKEASVLNRKNWSWGRA